MFEAHADAVHRREEEDDEEGEADAPSEQRDEQGTEEAIA